MNYRHSGMGWPNGEVKGGNQNILSLPSNELLMLSSEHWHVKEATDAGKRVVFRAMARPGYRPAEVGWNASRYVAEILRDVQHPQTMVKPLIREFVWANELNLQDERGDHRPDFGDLTDLFTTIGRFGLEVVKLLRRELPGVLIHYPAFAPKDETDYVHLWRESAEACDIIDVHAYQQGDGILGHIKKYRQLFPNEQIDLTEWHSYDNDGLRYEDDDYTLQLLADNNVRAYYFMWKWHNPPEHQRGLAQACAVEGHRERLDLFHNPPQAQIPQTPETPIVTLDPWQYYSAELIAEACEAPIENVRLHWPKIVEQLDHCGINSKAVQRFVIPTVGQETAHRFEPVREAFFLGESAAEEYRRRLQYYPYYGRGYQLTWKSNYLAISQKIAQLWNAGDVWANGGPLDLVADPDLAMDPDVAAAALALYVRDTQTLQGYSMVEAAEANDLKWFRRLYQGGIDGLQTLQKIVNILDGEPVPTGDRLYGPDIADDLILQKNDWSCSVRSTFGALKAMSYMGHGEDVSYGDKGPRDVYEWMVPQYTNSSVGLLAGDGSGLVEMLRGHGYNAERKHPSTIADVQAIAGLKPVLLGLPAWGPAGHWCYVRGVESDGTLIIENPAGTYQGISDRLRDSFPRLAGSRGATIVWIEPKDAGVEEVTKAEADALRAENVRLQEELSAAKTKIGYARGSGPTDIAGALQDGVDKVQSAINTLKSL